MILEIQKGENNPILRKKSLPIKSALIRQGREINDYVRKTAKNMIKTMKKNKGVGLSACQVGKNIRMFVVAKEICDKQIFVNPEIIKISKNNDVIQEGCLSVPRSIVPIKRALSLKIKALDENNEPFKLKAEGLLARVIQHEMDHLNGILITDHHE
jgi:peptide deformylase